MDKWGYENHLVLVAVIGNVIGKWKLLPKGSGETSNANYVNRQRREQLDRSWPRLLRYLFPFVDRF
jgi:hypothetical protein